MVDVVLALSEMLKMVHLDVDLVTCGSINLVRGQMYIGTSFAVNFNNFSS